MTKIQAIGVLVAGVLMFACSEACAYPLADVSPAEFQGATIRNQSSYYVISLERHGELVFSRVDDDYFHFYSRTFNSFVSVPISNVPKEVQRKLGYPVEEYHRQVQERESKRVQREMAIRQNEIRMKQITEARDSTQPLIAPPDFSSTQPVVDPFTLSTANPYTARSSVKHSSEKDSAIRAFIVNGTVGLIVAAIVILFMLIKKKVMG